MENQYKVDEFRTFFLELKKRKMFSKFCLCIAQCYNEKKYPQQSLQCLYDYLLTIDKTKIINLFKKNSTWVIEQKIQII